MKLGIIGLPQCGKTTLFNVLTGGKKTTTYHIRGGSQVQIHTAVVDVPDHRVDWLSQHYCPKKTTYAKITFQDISSVETNQGAFSPTLLHALSQVQGFVHVVRTFQEQSVANPLTPMDATTAISTIQNEFVLNDMITVERKLQGLKLEWSKGGGRDRITIEREQRLFTHLKTALEDGQSLIEHELSVEDSRLLSGFGLLTRKPMLLILNSDEEESNPEKILDPEVMLTYKQNILIFMGKLEMEIAQLDDKDAALFRKEYSISEPGLTRVIKRAYEMLGLHSFFTVSEDEVRAWPLRYGFSAIKAAGTIHSDMQAGFIRSEVMPFANLQQLGSEASMKSSGKWRLEGKNYVVQDGDILRIRFSPPAQKQV